MSKFLMFGMPLSQVVACATVNAARVFPAFDDRGTLNVGAPADIAYSPNWSRWRRAS
jgi:dihydroorotase